jgi:hypothetical protein
MSLSAVSTSKRKFPSHGRNDVMYPTAEMATATLAMASERKYRYEEEKP